MPVPLQRHGFSGPWSLVSRAIARALAAGVVRNYESKLPSAAA